MIIEILFLAIIGLIIFLLFVEGSYVILQDLIEKRSTRNVVFFIVVALWAVVITSRCTQQYYEDTTNPFIEAGIFYLK